MISSLMGNMVTETIEFQIRGKGQQVSQRAVAADHPTYAR
jgi:hypothetical protein